MRDRQGVIRVGLKYCGGCRSGYDRVGLVDSLKRRLAGVVEFTAADDEDARMVLVVCGCPSACARVETNLPIRYISSPEDAEKWIIAYIESEAELQPQTGEEHGGAAKKGSRAEATGNANIVPAGGRCRTDSGDKSQGGF